MPLEGIHVDDKLQFVEEPVEIMEREIKRLKQSRIPLVKVRWNSRRGPEFTWEREDSFKQKYPQLFTNRASSSTTRGLFTQVNKARGETKVFLLLLVDDIVLTASSDCLLQQIITSLHHEFSMTNLGALNYFLGISVTRDSSGMFLSQCKYVMEILEHAHMVGCNSSQTPVDIESKLGVGGTPVVDPTLYQRLTGSLQYLTFTRPDTTYAVQQVCLYMHDPWEPHFFALKRILRVEAEYRGVANAVAETCWIRNLLRELHTPLSSATIVYCDNVSVYIL
ncbi:ribonuclease H-like domain-containing protein [Tanacetum coccineum]